jgi:hypothetical protein
MFHHILEKRQKKFSHEDYTAYRHCEWNILLLCWQCHDAYERNPDTRPFIVDVKSTLLHILSQPHAFDYEDIWLTETEVNILIIHQLFADYPLKFN